MIGRLNAAEMAVAELREAQRMHAPMASPHEGYAVMLEEMDELWTEIKSKDGLESGRMRTEAIQVAAMALRFIIDCCEVREPPVYDPAEKS